jgi:hypothetical protein
MKTGYVVGTVVVGLALVASLIAAERSTHAYATPYMLQFTSNGEVCAQLKLLKNSTLDIGATNANAKGEITILVQTHPPHGAAPKTFYATVHADGVDIISLDK